MKYGAFLFLSCLLFSGCASLSEIECATADWYMIGFEDGSAGYGADRIGAHRKACANSGVQPDLEAWQAGREDGLVHFCTPAGGLEVGLKGEGRRDICPAGLTAGFTEGYRLGREIHTVTANMEQIQQEIRALEAQLSGDILEQTVSDRTRSRIRQLEREYGRLEFELRALEFRADRLSAG